MKNIVIVADDLTGAADTGVQFCDYFNDTVLMPCYQLKSDIEQICSTASRATAVYTNSRGLDAYAARNRLRSVADQLAQSDFTWMYKKIDSCMRGNLGAEIETLMDKLAFDVSFIAPAFPELGRTTVNGVHLVHGIPVDQTEIARDPVTPVTDPRLSHVVAAQSRYKVGHVALRFLDGNEPALQEEIDRQIGLGARHLVFDAGSQEHLDKIAHAALASQRKILAAGSAGLATSFAQLLTKGQISKHCEKKSSVKRNHLLVCGTTSEITKMQIATLIDAYPYEEIILEVGRLADQNQRNMPGDMVAAVRAKLAAKHVVIRIDSAPNADVPVTKDRRLDLAERLVKGLAFFVASVLAEVRPRFLFVTGGDTADALLNAVAARGIRIHDEIVAGMVRGMLLGGPLDGLPIVTKAGAFGQKDTLVALHEIWQHDHRENNDAS